MGTYNNFKIDRGCDFSRTVALTSGGTPVDMTGYVLKMGIADPTGTKIATIPGNGTATLTGTSPFVVAYPHTFTATLTPMVATYDIVLQDGSGNLAKRLEGTIEIKGTLAV
jgi:hypothetical protein